MARGDDNTVKQAGVNNIERLETSRFGFHQIDVETIPELLTTCYWYSNFLRFIRTSICFKENLRDEMKLDNGVNGLIFIGRDFLYLHGNLKEHNASEKEYDIITKSDYFTCYDPEDLKIFIYENRIKEII